jgi:hypothetical protein
MPLGLTVRVDGRRLISSLQRIGQRARRLIALCTMPCQLGCQFLPVRLLFQRVRHISMQRCATRSTEVGQYRLTDKIMGKAVCTLGCFVQDTGMAGHFYARKKPRLLRPRDGARRQLACGCLGGAVAVSSLVLSRRGRRWGWREGWPVCMLGRMSPSRYLAARSTPLNWEGE